MMLINLVQSLGLMYIQRLDFTPLASLFVCLFVCLLSVQFVRLNIRLGLFTFHSKMNSVSKMNIYIYIYI